MSAINDYGALLVDVGEYSGRNDIVHVFSRFVGLAESKINRLLRTADMETTATVTLIDGNADLPDDFLEARAVTSSRGPVINAWSLSELKRRFGSFGGPVQGYAVVGKVIQARPIQTGSLTLDYYARIPPLTPAHPTNWLLEKSPEVYLFGLVEEVAIWEQNADKRNAALGLKMDAIKDLKRNDQNARWSNGQFVMGMTTP